MGQLLFDIDIDYKTKVKLNDDGSVSIIKIEVYAGEEIPADVQTRINIEYSKKLRGIV